TELGPHAFREDGVIYLVIAPPPHGSEQPSAPIAQIARRLACGIAQLVRRVRRLVQGFGAPPRTGSWIEPVHGGGAGREAANRHQDSFVARHGAPREPNLLRPPLRRTANSLALGVV